MTTSEREKLLQILVVDEGVRLFPYRDTVGKLTIGIGRNLTDVGITNAEAFYLLEHDIDRAVRDLVAAFPWVIDLSSARIAALANLSFNLGITKLRQFVNTMAAVERGNWDAAAQGLRNSLWYQQVSRGRSERIIKMLVTGEWPNEARA